MKTYNEHLCSVRDLSYSHNLNTLIQICCEPIKSDYEISEEDFKKDFIDDLEYFLNYEETEDILSLEAQEVQFKFKTEIRKLLRLLS